MNRRQFLARSAAVAAAVGAGARSAAAQQDPLPCGLLGINHSHAFDVLEVLRQSPDYRVVGVCEPDAAVRAEFQDQPLLKDLRWLTEDELLGDPGVRMVAVESDVPRLLDLGRKVIDAGKHLHLDKPAGASLPVFKALLDEAERRQLLVQMGYMFRYNPGFDLVRKAVGDGWLGEVYSIRASMCTDINEKKRRIMAHHPGGLMLELGCHLIDMIVLLLGPPKKVIPYLRHDAPVDDSLADNTLAVLEYDHALVTVESAAMEPAAFPARRFKVAGTGGSAILQPLEPPAARLALREPRGGYKAGEQAVPLENVPRHVRDFADLAACIRGEKTFAYTKQHDYDVQQTVLRACGEG
jgi:predicted dehydrogenase